MKKDAARLRAELLWEASCERLRNALLRAPDDQTPLNTPADQAAAIRLVRDALDQLEAALRIDLAADDDRDTGSD